MSYNKTFLFALTVAAALIVTGANAQAQNQFLGDVNHNGTIDVSDVQSTVAQALGALAPMGEADLDGNNAVDVLDVQNMVNSALETGGMFQRCTGVINVPGERTRLWIRAVSAEGMVTRAQVDPATGQFTLRLRTRTCWGLMLCRSVQEGAQVREQVVATLRLRLGSEDETSLLPLMNMGRQMLNLGVLDLEQNRLRSRETFQRLISFMAGPMDASDHNEDGVPDFVEPLLERLRQNAPGVPDAVNLAGLKALIRPCIQAWVEAGIEPDLTDANEDQIPDFVEPLLLCIRDALADWLEEQNVPFSPADNDSNGYPDAIDNLMAHLRNGMTEWLRQAGPAELVDEDGDGIPDHIQGAINRVGQAGPMDSDGDGIPNFAEDNDGDGIPNCEDSDCSMQDDDDCDGIPNAYDWDRNNNGVMDYAE